MAIQKIGSLLDPNRFKKLEDDGKKHRPINEKFEQAKEFGKYVGIDTILVMRLFKIYGVGEVLGIRSWLADCPFDNRKGGKFTLAIWKLKENKVLKDEREKKRQALPELAPLE